MRILHAIQELSSGGAEGVVVRLGCHARHAGHEVAVVTAGGRLVAEFPGPAYPLRRVERRVRNLAGAARDVRHAVAEFGPDLVHAHNPAVALVCRLGTLPRRPPLVTTVHGLPGGDYARASRLLRAVGGCVVACGPGVLTPLAAHGLAPRLIVNGVGPAPVPADTDGLRRELDLDPSARMTIVVGRLVASKNQAVVLHAVAALGDVALLVVGEGPEHDALASTADRLGLADRVRFLGDRPDARALIGACELLFSASRSEGLPMVVLEAFSAGVPVVACEARGITELLAPDAGGILVAPDDAAALAAAARRVLDDAALARTLAGRARATAADHSDDAMAQGYLRLYEEVSGCRR
jgi:glycosyltransferase involved in cell wall biosynthesis